MKEIHSSVLTVEDVSILSFCHRDSTWMKRWGFSQELQQGDIFLYGLEFTFQMETC